MTSAGYSRILAAGDRELSTVWGMSGTCDTVVASASVLAPCGMDVYVAGDE